jgi:two-component system response regulator HydG
MPRVLVVDDDSDLRLAVSTALSESDFQVEQACDGEEALNRVQAGRFDLVLLDVNMPRMTGLQALKEIKGYDPSIIVIMLTAFANVRDAVEATREGAWNYLEKPINSENLAYLVNRALKAHTLVRNLSLSAPVFKLPNGTDFIGQSTEMKKIFGIIDKLARVDTAVLIRGESGTGKELVALALHHNSPRKDNRFVTVNCSAVPETLIESEFFGHEKGAFTGADSRKIGKFQYADGGTLFLDEIGDISAAMQVKLLRALQEKRFTPVGANREVEVNVRIVAATNRNLEEMIRRGEFREDLFYRLNVLPIQLPPLRDRKNDIEVLVGYFIEKFNQQHRKNITLLSPEAMDALKAHGWPGNIRELENVIEHAFVIESGSEIQIDSLPEAVRRNFKRPEPSPGLRFEVEAQGDHQTLGTDLNPDLSEEEQTEVQIEARAAGASGENLTGFTLDVTRLDFQASKELFEKQFLMSALKAFSGKINQTALHANIPKKTLLRKLEKYGINAKEYTRGPGSSN